jgi:secreted trypsin-like serine protease
MPSNIHRPFFPFFLGLLLCLSALDTAYAARGPQSIGGQAVSISSHPYMVSLVRMDYNGFDAHANHFCGGSLISSTWVLTAAHCLHDGFTEMEESELRVVHGRTTLSDARYSDSVGVKRIYLHNSFVGFTGTETAQYDYALLELRDPISSQTIAVDDGSQPSLSASSTEVTAAGWGVTSLDAESVSDVLRAVDLKIYRGGSIPAYLINDGVLDSLHVVAGVDARNKAVAPGDSGGPLIAVDESGNPVVVGVASYINHIDETDIMSVFAKAQKAMSFITKYVPDVKTPQLSENESKQMATGAVSVLLF